MHEREKLGEARHFLERMEVTKSNPETFHYELSAYLAAARSVLQYAFEEARQNAQGRQWYDNRVSGDPILKFFKDKRDMSVHRMPVRPQRNISISVTEHIGISDSVRIEVQNADGTKQVYETAAAPPPILAPQPSTAEVDVRYLFVDWQGPDDVITLSRQYLTALETLVAEGIGAGHISG